MILPVKPMRLLIIVFLVLFMVVPKVGTEQVAMIDGHYVPVNLRLDNSLSENDMFVNAEVGVEWFMKNWDIKGASVAVAKEGKLLYARGFGCV